MSSGLPDESGVAALAQHWKAISAGLVLLLLFAKGVMNTVRFVFWGDKRVEHFVNVALHSEAFDKAAEKIARAIAEPLRAHIDDLTARDLERKEAVGRAHSRIDDVQRSTTERIDRLQAQLLEAVSKGKT